MLRTLTIFLLASRIAAQGNDGDSCVDQHTNTVGKCTAADRCTSAKDDFQKNGITPSFCKYSAFGSPVICCRDSSTILQAAPAANSDGPPVWGLSGSDTRRVSERKCEQYSRGVTEKVDFIPLLPNPETMSISSAKCEYTGVELIVGGERAAGEFPHMAAIGFTNFDGGYNFSCGGSLISPRFVLTAGHCIRDPGAKDPEPVIVRLGDQNIDPAVDDGAKPIDVPIKKIHKHPEYKPPKRYNDIALLELNSDVEFESAIRPACLWRHSGYGEHRKAIATGWVIDPDTKETAKELQKVSLSLFGNEDCDRRLANTRYRHWKGLIPSQMCAGELRGEDTCQGDSGSPLQIASKENQCIFHIIGVTSFGKKCAESGLPAVYTRISSYLDWIEGIVWPGE
ncbi:LOW QUALITY PROTEIN: venom protease [Aphomia sociella]